MRMLCVPGHWHYSMTVAYTVLFPVTYQIGSQIQLPIRYEIKSKILRCKITQVTYLTII
jgi:hypothetical protein